jgi:LacI family transcriptional regulator
MPRKKKTTLLDIAQEMKVSTVTVSKALANKEGVGDDLRRKIKEMAVTMGYSMPSTKTVDTQSNGTGNIGILIPSRFFSSNSSFYWNLYNALSNELLKQNYYCIMEQLSSENEFDLVMPHMIQDKKIDGIIILGQICSDYARFFATCYKQFIFLDFYLSDENTDTVTTDNFYSEYIMTDYLISQGHKNIRFVGSFKATTSIRDRFMGFMKAMLENGCHVSFDEIIEDRDSTGALIPVTLPETMPTAFVCNCDETALHVMEALKKNGLSIPEDVSVVGFDNYISSGTASPALTTVNIDPAITARAAVEIIIRKINGLPYNHGHTVISGKLLLRDSVKKISQTSSDLP